VTGAYGQIGRDFMPILRQLFGESNVIASDIAKPTASKVVETYDNLKTIELDVCDKGAVRDAVKTFKVTRIVHLATMLSAVGEKLPIKAHDVNVQGTLNILEAAREIKVSTNGSKKMASVFAPSSIAVFGPSTPQDGTPDDVVCAPSTMYGISKHHLELLGNYYHQRYGLDFRSLRFPGVLSASDPGGGTTDYVMDMYNEALKYKQCTSFLSEDIELPFMHMEDCLRSAIELIVAPNNKLTRRVYNITAFSATPSQVYESIKKFIPEVQAQYEPDFREEIALSWPNSVDDSFARRDWGWQHAYDLDDITKDILDSLAAERMANMKRFRERLASRG